MERRKAGKRERSEELSPLLLPLSTPLLMYSSSSPLSAIRLPPASAASSNPTKKEKKRTSCDEPQKAVPWEETGKRRKMGEGPFVPPLDVSPQCLHEYRGASDMGVGWNESEK